jgi:hypothetical protein
MNNFWNLRNKRAEQLTDEKKIDEIINKNLKKCPNIILTFLLNMRHINRMHFSQLSNSSILDHFNRLEKNLSEIDDIYNEILESSDDFCSTLDTINREIEWNYY